MAQNFRRYLAGSGLTRRWVGIRPTPAHTAGDHVVNRSVPGQSQGV